MQGVWLASRGGQAGREAVRAHLVQGGGQMLQGDGVGAGSLQEPAVAPHHLLPAVPRDPAAAAESSQQQRGGLNVGDMRAGQTAGLFSFSSARPICTPTPTFTFTHSQAAAPKRPSHPPQERIVAVDDGAVCLPGVADGDALCKVGQRRLPQPQRRLRRLPLAHIPLHHHMRHNRPGGGVPDRGHRHLAPEGRAIQAVQQYLAGYWPPLLHGSADVRKHHCRQARRQQAYSSSLLAQLGHHNSIGSGQLQPATRKQHITQHSALKTCSNRPLPPHLGQCQGPDPWGRCDPCAAPPPDCSLQHRGISRDGGLRKSSAAAQHQHAVLKRAAASKQPPEPRG